jgi:hypothetical protein
MHETNLSLVVLRCSDLEASRAFYELLGLSPVREQHGDGPVHYSLSAGSTTIELYPSLGKSTSDLRIGISTPNLSEVRQRLEQSRSVGRHLVVVDPDGHVIELSQLTPEICAAHASVRFMGEYLDPFHVSRLLRLPCDHTHHTGEPRIRRRADGVIQEFPPYPSGMWSTSSKGWVKSTELDTHVRWLLDQLEPLKTEIAELLASGATADIFCFSEGPTVEPPVLPGETQDRAARLSLPIEIDHYGPRQDS